MEQEPQVLDLRDYLAVLRRRKWYVLGVTVLVVAAALIVTAFQTPLYESASELVVEPLGSQSDNTALERAIFGNTELETQRKIVTSVPVAERVADDLGLDDSRDAVEDLLEQVDVTLFRDTQILEIRATDEDPEMAAALANGFAEGYLSVRREDALQRVLQANADLEQRAENVRDRLDEIDTQLRRLPEGSSDADALQEERDSLLQQLGNISAQSSALEAADSFARGGGQILRTALVPQSPSSPKPLRTGVLAAVLGLMLGVGLAFVRDTLDDAVRTDDDVRRAVGRPVVAHIPQWQGAKQGGRVVTLVAPSSPVAEAYRGLRTNVKFLMAGDQRDVGHDRHLSEDGGQDTGEQAGRRQTRGSRSIIVTSAVEAEGKTTTAANLAVAAARSGIRVILVDSDMRRPTVHKTFGITDSPGLSELLVSDVALRDVLVNIGVQNLRILPSGQIPPNPAELLSSVLMDGVVDQLEDVAELVIFDTPPVLAVADAMELAAHISRVLIVTDWGRSRRRALQAASDRLSGVGGEIAGIVLNNVEIEESYYGYTYGSYYHGRDESTGRDTPSIRPAAPSRSAGKPASSMEEDRQAASTADEPAATAPSAEPPTGPSVERPGRPSVKPLAEPTVQRPAEHAVVESGSTEPTDLDPYRIETGPWPPSSMPTDEPSDDSPEPVAEHRARYSSHDASRWPRDPEVPEDADDGTLFDARTHEPAPPSPNEAASSETNGNGTGQEKEAGRQRSASPSRDQSGTGDHSGLAGRSGIDR